MMSNSVTRSVTLLAGSAAAAAGYYYYEHCVPRVCPSPRLRWP